MMAEQKGRGGKKPKYQIADIGGSDLTPQDLSTERVLNFLIKGEAPDVTVAGAAADIVDQIGPTLEQPPAGRSDEPADTSLPSSGAQGKKSLDHLFRRASAGGAAATKGLKLDLRGQEQPAQGPHVEDVKPVEPSQPSPPDFQAEDETGPVKLSPRPDMANDQPALPQAQASPQAEPAAHPQTAEALVVTPEVTTAAPAENSELTQLIILWKGLYRLKDSEIDALTALYRMSHDIGSDECYVKMRQLAEMSNLTYRYCQKVVRSLEQLGLITKLKDYDSLTQLGVLYRVNLKPSL